MIRAPMHKLTPQEHADTGWSWGAYRDGSCFCLMGMGDPDEVAEFRMQAARDGAEVIYLPPLRSAKP
jgi:hypothetical protein